MLVSSAAGREEERQTEENCLELVFPILKFSWVPWGPVFLFVYSKAPFSELASMSFS